MRNLESSSQSLAENVTVILTLRKMDTERQPIRG